MNINLYSDIFYPQYCMHGIATNQQQCWICEVDKKINALEKLVKRVLDLQDKKPDKCSLCGK